MKYFLTGGTGFIGGRIALQLLEAGHRVVALARSQEKAAGLQALGVSVSIGDITRKETLRAPMTGADGVFHVAGWYKVGAQDTSMAEEVNVAGTRNVLETMKELGISKGVYTSSLAVFSDTHGRVVDETYRYNGPHLSEYDRTKWLAHHTVAEPMIRAGLPLVIVQPGLVYGPGDESPVSKYLQKFLQGKLPMMPVRTGFCFSHVDDVARGHILAMEKGRVGESYILGGPIHTFVEAIKLAERITGIKGPLLQVSPAFLKALSVVAGFVGSFGPLPEDYAAESLRVIAGVTYLANNAKARRELGFSPRPLADGLRETLEFEMSRLGMRR